MQSETADCARGAATWLTGRNERVVFDFGQFAPLCEDMTSSTKPKVHNLLHWRQRKTEPRPLVTCTGSMVKFGHVVFEICARRNRQTDKQTRKSQYFAPLPGRRNQSIYQIRRSLFRMLTLKLTRCVHGQRR